MLDLRRLTGRAWRGVVAVVLLLSTFAGGASATEDAAPTEPRSGEPRTFTGSIDGAEYRVEIPARWNGTLVLYSHGYYPPGFDLGKVWVTNSAEAEEWLLDHGFALAASNYRGVFGYQVEQGYHDQLALLGWFDAEVGRPRRTILTAQSLGAPIALRLAEEHPRRFDGVSTVCAAHDPQGNFNAALDMNFAVETLLVPEDLVDDVDLVRVRDPATSTRLLQEAIDQALTTPQGRARLALVASLANITGWFSAHQPQPTDPAVRLEHQVRWIRDAYIGGSGGPLAHFDLDAKAGGNPSFNVGVDYRRQLDRSSQRRDVVAAYRDAGLDLQADLDRLNAAPRIEADPVAVEFMERGVPQGRTPVPVVTLHTTGDAGAVPDHERWLAEQVRRHGDPSQLRQLYVERGMHCSLSAAEEITALQTLLHRLDTGHWPSTSPERLNAQASAFDPQYRQVLDFSAFDPVTGEIPSQEMPPTFTRFRPPRPMRPTR